MDTNSFKSHRSFILPVVLGFLLQSFGIQLSHAGRSGDTGAETRALTPIITEGANKPKIKQFTNPQTGQLMQSLTFNVPQPKESSGVSTTSPKSAKEFTFTHDVNPKQYANDWRKTVAEFAILKERQRLEDIRSEKARQKGAAEAEAAHHQAILNKTNMTVFKETLVRLPAEKVKFAMAQFIVQYHQTWLYSEGDPRKMAEFFEHLNDPISDIGFFFFMLANGYTTHALTKYGIKNLDVRNRAALFNSLKYIGMSVGLVASQIFHEASETFKACALADFKNYDGKSIAERSSDREASKKACDESWRLWHTENIAKRYIPSIFGLALGTYIQSRLTKYGQLFANSPPGKAIFVRAFNFTVAWKFGRFVISKANMVTGTLSLAGFLGLDYYITPPLTRGYGIFSDSMGTKVDEWKNYSLENLVQKCAQALSIVKNDRPVPPWLKERCASNLNNAILDWRDIHNNWRLNINSEWEAANASYAKFIKKITDQYMAAQSYYLALLERRFKDKIEAGKLDAKIILLENSLSVQDHLNRLYPFFGIYVGGSFVGDIFADRSAIQSKVASQYFGGAVALEDIQLQRLKFIAHIMFRGLNSLTQDQASFFLIDNFGLYEHAILHKLKERSIDWAQSNPQHFGKNVIPKDDYYQWIKENILKTQENEKAAHDFSARVIVPTLFDTSDYWRTGISELLGQDKKLTLPAERESLLQLRELLLSTKKSDLVKGILLWNEIVLGNSGKPRTVTGDAHSYLKILRDILGNPHPILFKGMAFPYIFEADPGNHEMLKPNTYQIPKNKYQYLFHSASEYFNHEMICGEEKARIVWSEGWDAVFNPPKVVAENPASRRAFCHPQALMTGYNHYSLQYTKSLSLFSTGPLVGVLPNILANLIPDLEKVDVNQAISGDSTTARDKNTKVEMQKISDWWIQASTVEFESFLEKREKTWIESHKKLQFNLTRSDNITRDMKWDSYANIVNPMLEKLRVGEKLPFNLVSALAVEWDQYTKVLNALNGDSSLSAEISEVQKAFTDSMNYLVKQSKIDFLSEEMAPLASDPKFKEKNEKQRKFKFNMNKEIIDLNFALTDAITKIKQGLEKKNLKLSETLTDGMTSASRAIGGYMDSATLAIYDPVAGAYRTEKAISDITKAKENAIKKATQGHRP